MTSDGPCEKFTSFRETPLYPTNIQKYCKHVLILF